MNEKEIEDYLSGASPPIIPKPSCEPIPRPFPWLGFASFMTPFIAMGIALIVVVESPRPSRPEYLPEAFLRGLVAYAVVSIIGTALSVCSLWKKERSMFAIFGLVMNAGFFLGGFRLLFR